jgi:hypothetical protein
MGYPMVASGHLLTPTTPILTTALTIAAPFATTPLLQAVIASAHMGDEGGWLARGWDRTAAVQVRRRPKSRRVYP